MKHVSEQQLVLYYYRSEEHTSELQSQSNLVCRLLLEKKKNHFIHKKRAFPVQPASLKDHHPTIIGERINRDPAPDHQRVLHHLIMSYNACLSCRYSSM